MRGDDLQQSAVFSYISPEERVPKDHPLRAIRTLTDRVLRGLSATFDGMYSPIGRRSVPPEKLLRALLLPELCTWFSLGDAVRGVGDVRSMMFPAIA